MDQSAGERQLMVQYLLGECSEEDRLRLEAAWFADDACYRQLLETEDDLVYQWIRGELAPAAHERFGNRLRTSDSGREKAAFAEALTGTAGRLARNVPAAAPRRGFRRLGWLLPVAASLTLGILGWEWIQLTNLRTQVSTLNAQAGAERNLAARLPAAPAISFALSPGLSRGTDQLRRLQIPSGAASVRFQLLLRAPASFSRYRVSLVTADGRELWSQAGAWPSGTSVDVEAPASVLGGDEYDIILQGQQAGGEVHQVARYHFAAERGR